MRSRFEKIALIIIVILLLALIAAAKKADGDRQRAAKMLFDADTAHLNERARADSTRTLYEDSLRRVQVRWSEQRKNDSIKLRKMEVFYTVRMDSIQAVAVEAPVRIDTLKDTRLAEFDVDSTWYHLKASVSMPPPPNMAQASFLVTIPTFKVRTFSDCGPALPSGMRPLLTGIETPPFLHLDIVESVGSVDVCPMIPKPPNLLSKVSKVGKLVGLGVVIGVVITR